MFFIFHQNGVSFPAFSMTLDTLNNIYGITIHLVKEHVNKFFENLHGYLSIQVRVVPILFLGPHLSFVWKPWRK